jgi:hypothetical protein
VSWTLPGRRPQARRRRHSWGDLVSKYRGLPQVGGHRQGGGGTHRETLPRSNSASQPILLHNRSYTNLLDEFSSEIQGKDKRSSAMATNTQYLRCFASNTLRLQTSFNLGTSIAFGRRRDVCEMCSHVLYLVCIRLSVHI